MNRHSAPRGAGGRAQPSTLPRLLLLALFFLGGIVLGQVLAGRVPDSTGTELERYLNEYLHMDSAALTAETAWAAAVIYFRYPLAVFLLGFASVGVALVPLSALACGLFLSFSVCCFTAAFGGDGVVLALAVFAPRCLVMLPCFFLLAVPAWGTSASLASLSFGRGRRAAPTIYGRPDWLRAAAAAGLLAGGVCAELFLVPSLVRLALERILI